MTGTFGQKAHARQQLLRTDTLGGVNSNGEAGKRDRIRVFQLHRTPRLASRLETVYDKINRSSNVT